MTTKPTTTKPKYLTVEYTEVFSHTFTVELPEYVTLDYEALDQFAENEIQNIVELASDLSGYSASAHNYLGTKLQGMSVDDTIPSY